MRTLTICCVLCVTISGSARVEAEDGLFSEVSIDSVFTPKLKESGGNRDSSAGTARTPSGVGRRFSGTTELTDALLQIGFEPRPAGEGVLSIRIERGDWTFPALVMLSENQKELWLVLLLSSIKDEKQVPAGRLLQLMSATREYAPAYFAYSEKRKRTELYRVFENSQLTAERLREELNRLTEIALETESLWNFEGTGAGAAPQLAEATPGRTETAPSTPRTSPTPPSTPGTPPAATTPGKDGPGERSAPPTSIAVLVGKWSAALSTNSAFAIQLNSDGTFVLVHVGEKKQSRSSGKYTLENTQLTLAGDDGTKLTGKITINSADQFVLQLQNATSRLTFQRAK